MHNSTAILTKVTSVSINLVETCTYANYCGTILSSWCFHIILPFSDALGNYFVRKQNAELEKNANHHDAKCHCSARSVFLKMLVNLRERRLFIFIFCQHMDIYWKMPWMLMRPRFLSTRQEEQLKQQNLLRGPAGRVVLPLKTGV